MLAPMWASRAMTMRHGRSGPFPRYVCPVGTSRAMTARRRAVRSNLPAFCCNITGTGSRPIAALHRVLGPVGENLNTPFGHDAGFDPGNGEGNSRGTGFGLDRPLHPHERTHGKSRSRKPSMVLGRVGDRKGDEVEPRVPLERRVEFARERRLGGLEQYLHVAAPEHHRHVAGAGELRRAAGWIRMRLNRQRRGREPGLHERAAGRFRFAHEMREMVEEDFSAQRKLAVGFGCVSRGRSPWPASQLSARPTWPAAPAPAARTRSRSAHRS